MPVPHPQTTILVVEDDEPYRNALKTSLEGMGCSVHLAANLGDAAEALKDPSVSLVLLDLKLPDGMGLDLLVTEKERLKNTPVIVVTGHGTTDRAMQAIKLGACDFIIKNADLEELRLRVEKALKKPSPPQHQADDTAAQVESNNHAQSEELIGSSLRMIQLGISIVHAAAWPVVVLITGESGTGKELVARALHRYSNRADKPFIPINCAAIPVAVAESELFGHEKGAFTDAVSRRIGKFEKAHGGTLFLDEIGELDLSVQAKLLRAIQDRSFERVGANDPIEIDIRLIAATNKDLRALIAQGRFRQDLYYRLNECSIELPPLRERREDIPLLANHCLRLLASKGWPHLALSDEAVGLLRGYDWPGNVRELENVIKNAAVQAQGGLILPKDLPKHLRLDASPRSDTERNLPSLQTTNSAESGPKQKSGEPGVNLPLVQLPIYLPEFLEQIERQLLVQALKQSDGNQKEAAKLLGIPVRTLGDRIRKYGLHG